jgi:hypothetical protein
MVAFERRGEGPGPHNDARPMSYFNGFVRGLTHCSNTGTYSYPTAGKPFLDRTGKNAKKRIAKN